MITINVAPEIKISAQYTDLVIGLFVLILFVGLSYSAPLAYGFFIDTDIENIKKSIEEKNKQKQNAEVDSKKAKEIQQITNELQQRQNRIKAINKDRKQVVKILEKLQILHNPEKMTLSNIILSGQSLQLIGIAADNGIIADYIRKLQDNTNDKNNDNILDIKNYEPKFYTIKTDETDEKNLNDSKIQFSNVTLRKSIAENIDTFITIIKFELDIQILFN